MIIFLWVILAALAVSSVLALMDVEIAIEGHNIGRPIYGVLVLLGLGACFLWVRAHGAMPLPGYGIALFSVLYLPFLWSSFIDLDSTDELARRELEVLLLEHDFGELRSTEGQSVIKEGTRKFRVHWESRVEADGVMIELDVHPSLLPITISRPHLAHVRSQVHLEHLRRQILERRTEESA